jgi:hypothetical protein
VLERYGNAAVAETPDESLLLGQTEAYVEYDASGTLAPLYNLCRMRCLCRRHGCELLHACSHCSQICWSLLQRKMWDTVRLITH